MRSLRGNARFLHLFRLPIMLLEPAAHLSLDSMLPLSSTIILDFQRLSDVKASQAAVLWPRVVFTAFPSFTARMCVRSAFQRGLKFRCRLRSVSQQS